MEAMYYYHALPEKWYEMKYSDFLEARRHRIAAIIKEGYGETRFMSIGRERRTAQDLFIRYAGEAGWTYLPPAEASRMRGRLEIACGIEDGVCQKPSGGSATCVCWIRNGLRGTSFT